MHIDSQNSAASLQKAGPGIDICTIQLRLSSDKAGDQELIRMMRDFKEEITTALDQALLGAIGVKARIRSVLFSSASPEILMRIGGDPKQALDYDSLSQILKDIVARQTSGILWTLGQHAPKLQIASRIYPEAALMNLHFGSLRHKKVRSAFKHPISVLLLGSILGSVLLPYWNDLSTQKKIRHEERVKIAVSIIEQSHETDRRMANLMDFLALFRKDHNDPSASPGVLKKEQYKAREKLNEMYLAFNAQAWWWHWNIRSESALEALATPREYDQISALSTQYSSALLDGTKAITSLWDPLLKKTYLPADPGYDVAIKQAAADLEKARVRRNAIALQMAQVFASDH